MITYPIIGQRVRLNNKGLESVHGLDKFEDFYDSQDMVITNIEFIPCTDAIMFQISVNMPSINKYLLTNYDIDAI